MWLYHWAPRERRRAIERRGLVPGSLSRDRAWRPPFICFADHPSMGWGLSGGMVNAPPGTWDLWQLDSESLTLGWEELYFDDGTPKEYRIYERVFKRDLWWVGERTVIASDGRPISSP